MEEKVEKVENKIQRIGRTKENFKVDDGPDKLHDLRRRIGDKIHEVQKKLDKVDKRIENNADTNTEEMDELAKIVRENLGPVKEKI